MIERPRIINVERKPSKCPLCGERVVDIIYGTGDMTEIDFMLEYRKEGIMGGLKGTRCVSIEVFDAPEN